jgi:hypothetical protein
MPRGLIRVLVRHSAATDPHPCFEPLTVGHWEGSRGSQGLARVLPGSLAEGELGPIP